MNVRSILPEIVICILMAISGVITVSRLWQDAIICIGILVLILTFGVLIILLILQLARTEEAAKHQERTMRANLESLGRQLIANQDANTQKILEAIEAGNQPRNRMYR